MNITHCEEYRLQFEIYIHLAVAAHLINQNVCHYPKQNSSHKISLNERQVTAQERGDRN